MATPNVVDKVQQIQVQKETAAQKANAEVMTDANAVHAVHTPWTAPTTLSSAGIGALIGLPFGGPFGAAVGAAIGAAVEHFRFLGGPVGKVTAKLGLFQPKAPPGVPPGSKPVVAGPGVPPPGMPTAGK